MLWITLFYRVGDEYRRIYPPFWSFAEIAAGNRRVIFETAANIVLFIPLGFFCRRMFGWNRRKTICIGFFISLMIEASQWIFRLGSTEVDDIVTNTLGTAIGALVPSAVCDKGKRAVIAACLSFVIVAFLPIAASQLFVLHMQHLAANNDLSDGTKNLLVLNEWPGYAGDSDVFVNYLPDGSISISGKSDIRTWKRIGNLTLGPGTYSFSGLNGTEPKTIALELEHYSEKHKNFVRLTPDIGPIEEAVFTLAEETKIRAYVGIYPGASGTYTARPVIYQLEPTP